MAFLSRLRVVGVSWHANNQFAKLLWFDLAGILVDCPAAISPPTGAFYDDVPSYLHLAVPFLVATSLISLPHLLIHSWLPHHHFSFVWCICCLPRCHSATILVSCHAALDCDCCHSSLVTAWSIWIWPLTYLMSVSLLLLHLASVVINSCTTIMLRRCLAGWGFGIPWHAPFNVRPHFACALANCCAAISHSVGIFVNCCAHTP